MVPTHPSYWHYRQGCDCLDCREIVRRKTKDYRDRRRLNGGLPLGQKGHRSMPPLIVRLYREIGIVRPKRRDQPTRSSM